MKLKKFLFLFVITAMLVNLFSIKLFADTNNNIDLQAISEAIEKYYNELLGEGNGHYSIFLGEHGETKTDYYLFLRYSRPDEEIDRLIKEGAAPSINVLTDTLFINKKTGEIRRESDNSILQIPQLKNNANDNLISKISVILNGRTLSFQEPPYIENGTTRVPMRTIFEALGAEIEYEASTKTITAIKDSTIIKLVIGNSTAFVNGKEIPLASSVENRNGSAMIPLRFVSEALGAEVIWNGENKIITINLVN